MYHLSSVPTELVADEIDLYNSVASIVSTGHDIDGDLKPFLYSKFTRNPPLYGIAAYASSLVFGKTTFGLRFPAVLFGLVAVLGMYALGYEISERYDVAITAALFQSVQPIFVQFSRIAWEPSSELPFLLFGLYFVVRALRQMCRERRPTNTLLFGMLLAAVLLGLTCYTYMTGWFYVVILAGALTALYSRQIYRHSAIKQVLAACMVWLVVSAPALWMCFFDPLTASKVSRIGTFSHGLSLHALQIFTENYLAHFRLSYLVLSGDPQWGSTWRYLNGFGAFYWWLLPLAVVGVFTARAYIADKRVRLWLYVWLLAYPLAGAITNDGVPNAPRTLAGAAVFCMFGAIGFVFCYDQAAKRSASTGGRLALGLLCILLAASVTSFARFYFTQYVHRNSNAWDSGTRAMFAAVHHYRRYYDRVCFSVWPAWYGIDSYVRFYLPGDRNVLTDIADPACFTRGTLLVTDNNHPKLRSGFMYLTTVRDVDGNGFAIIRGKPRSGVEPPTELNARGAAPGI